MSLAPLHSALATAIEKRGYEELTPVQQLMLAQPPGADLLVSAQTGSGKTVAFGLAIAPTVLGDDQRFAAPALPLGLVIAPTRELALQVRRELDWLYAEAGIVTASAVGGMDQRTERRALERGAHIVIGTPGRLRDHITRGALDLSAIRAVILDEADEMLDLGFREDLEFILGAAPEERRTLMFSATVPTAIARLAETFQKDAIRVTATAASERHADIEYQVMLVQKDEREHAVINALLYFDSTNSIVFCHTREAVKHLAARLANRGFAVVALSGELTQSERTNALQAMRDGRARVCVATDVAARGIDLPNLDLVIHADVPSNPDTLLHRSGRTGRAGRKGTCVLVVPIHRRGSAARVLKLANLEAQTRTAPTIADIEQRQQARILQSAEEVSAPTEAEAGLVAQLVEKLTPEQLATLWLRQQMASNPSGEELYETRIPTEPGKGPRRDKRFADTDEPSPRGDFTDGVWFSLSLGRKHRADPKWILPLLCKAGGITKRDIGAIRIFEGETKFEITAASAAAFAEQVAVPGALEKGARISPVSEKLTRSGKPFSRPRTGRPEAAEASPKPKKWQPAFDGPASPAPAPREPHFKVRSDKGEDLGTQPATRPSKPKKPKVNTKDKGKPKYKNRPNATQHAGDAPRKKPRSLPQD